MIASADGGAFTIGLIIYACGSGLTAVSWSVGTLALGWSVLEGIGAALVLPALAALIAGNYSGKDRVVAYAVVGGVAGAGIAVGPILGGWVTTEFTWRYVFVGEVVLVGFILVIIRLLRDAPLPGRPPQIDWVGSVLSSLGLGLIVLGILQASTWGWIEPKNSPWEPFGFAITPFVVMAGAAVLWLFVRWQHRREDKGLDPLVHLALLRIASLRSGVETFLSQNLILMGVFFAVPLYLQLVQGLDAFETGIKMLPVSVTMFITSMAGSALAARFAPRKIIRLGLAILLLSIGLLLSNIQPDLDDVSFAIAMGLLGVGLGLIASQLGNVVQSSVDDTERGEAGGLQYTSQQLGSAIGVALIGAVVLTGLTTNFVEPRCRRSAHQRRRRADGERRGGQRGQLRCLHRSGTRGGRRRPRRSHHERPRRGLREGATRSAQGRLADRRIRGRGGLLLHGGPSVAQTHRRRGRAGRCQRRLTRRAIRRTGTIAASRVSTCRSPAGSGVASMPSPSPSTWPIEPSESTRPVARSTR